MQVLISDYKEQMEPDYSLTMEAVREQIPDIEVCVEAYGTPDFYKALENADGLITAFIPVDEELLGKAPRLKCVSQNAAGYSNVDVEALQRRGISLYYIREYCTREVAEHAISMLLALNHQLIGYRCRMEDKGEWQYQSIPAGRTLNHQTLAIFGLGRIGRMTASLALALGMKVLAVDPYVSPLALADSGIRLVSGKEALAKADAVINHMALTKENYHYFDAKTFAQMKKTPVFINVGRGGCVDEQALADALDTGLIRAAGLDVLESENPDMQHCPFLHRDNVIMTPHSAFYSQDSIKALHRISGQNMAEGLMKSPKSSKLI